MSYATPALTPEHITGAQKRHENTEAWHGWATGELKNMHRWASWLLYEDHTRPRMLRRGRLFVARKEVTEVSDAELLAWLLRARREYAAMAN